MGQMITEQRRWKIMFKKQQFSKNKTNKKQHTDHIIDVTVDVRKSVFLLLVLPILEVICYTFNKRTSFYTNLTL